MAYGHRWQATKKFATDFNAWLRENADDRSTVFFAFSFIYWLKLHLGTREDLLCEFSVENVEHLRAGRVVRVRPQPIITLEGKKFSICDSKTGTYFQNYRCRVIHNGSDCRSEILVPIASIALPECATTFARDHFHQRVSKRCSNVRIEARSHRASL